MSEPDILTTLPFEIIYSIFDNESIQTVILIRKVCWSLMNNLKNLFDKKYIEIVERVRRDPNSIPKLHFPETMISMTQSDEEAIYPNEYMESLIFNGVDVGHVIFHKNYITCWTLHINLPSSNFISYLIAQRSPEKIIHIPNTDFQVDNNTWKNLREELNRDFHFMWYIYNDVTIHGFYKKIRYFNKAVVLEKLNHLWWIIAITINPNIILKR